LEKIYNIACKSVFFVENLLSIGINNGLMHKYETDGMGLTYYGKRINKK